MLNFLFRIAYSIMKCTLGGIILIGLLFLVGLLLFWLFDFSSIEGWIPIIIGGGGGILLARWDIKRKRKRGENPWT